MHPALHSWRDEWPGHAVRLMAYVGGIVLMSMVATELYQSKPLTLPIASRDPSGWIEVDIGKACASGVVPSALDHQACHTG